MKLIQNIAGRLIPDEINGQTGVPFQGIGQYKPGGRTAGRPIRSCADFPVDGNKVVPDMGRGVGCRSSRDK